MPGQFANTNTVTQARQDPFNVDPGFQSGTGVFGQVPGNLGLPPVAAELNAQLPGLQGMNEAASSDILSNLQGNLSPGTQNALQSASADYGVTSGMPGSGLNWNSLYGNIANASQQQQQLGLQEYNQTLPTVSGTQTVSPDLQTQISFQNAVDAASPNPVDAGIADIATTIGSQLLGGGAYNVNTGTQSGSGCGGGGGCGC